MMSLREELAMVLNKHSRENFSNTPDFILAEYLISCLSAFETATRERENWYGHEHHPCKVKAKSSDLTRTKE